MVGIIISVLLCLSINLKAQELPRDNPYWSVYNMHFYEFDNYAKKLSQRLPRATPESRQACSARYDELYKDGVLNVFVGFGYTDEDTLVRDPLSSRALAAHLKQACRPNYELCGFIIKSENPFILTKQISTPQGRPVVVNVVIVNGAYTPNDSRNRSTLAAKQEAQSSLAESVFFSEGRKAHILLYSGHSRNGGGPDFRPPRMVGRHVDYPWYESNRPGVRALVNNLKLRSEPLDMFGMFSCYSRGHFSGLMNAVSPKTGLIFGYGEAWFNADSLIAGTINGILRRSCKDEFDTIFNDVELDGRPQFFLSGFWQQQKI